MQTFLQNTISWPRFFFAALFLIFLYIIIGQLLHFIARIDAVKNNRILSEVIKTTLLLYEPVLAILLTTYFVRIHPMTHGLIVLGLIILCFGLLRDYFSGIVFRISKQPKLGMQMAVDPVRGVVSQLHRLGLDLETGSGISYVRYHKIMQAHNIITGESMKGMVNFSIATEDVSEKKQAAIKRVLQLAPYVDWSWHPMLSAADQKINVQLRLHDTRYIKDLMALLQEQDFKTNF